MNNPESPYIIRNANLEDVDAILAMEGEAFPEGNNTGPRGLSRDIAEHAPSVKLAITDDTIVGIVRGALHPSKIPNRCYGDIVSLSVASEHRRRGLGGLLLQEMITEMLTEDPTGIMLHTRVSNKAMQGLALKHDFIIDHEVENYYLRTAVPEGAFMMVRRSA